MVLNVPWFSDKDILAFPSVDAALREPDGLLVIGGNLSVQTLKKAYRSGVFPWFEDGQPIMWWSPSIRAVIPTRDIHVSKNMAKLMKQNRYQVKVDRDFSAIVRACSNRAETWITDDMQAAYQQLHQQGIAHSVGVYDEDDALVGGLYGVFTRNCFCGESMFSLAPNTSKLALITLAQCLTKYDCELIDCQLPTQHLHRMGAKNIPRAEFIKLLHGMADNTILMETTWERLWQPY